ncbi:MAG: polysaccharide deacetylase family protein [candidate division WOR-3 bacterium]|jgi:peptidoglycan/xylan/chitin deacetylase (PgdA/CDA1 family)
MRIPVLCYHNISRAPYFNVKRRSLHTTPLNFYLQMKLLHILGYKGLSVSDAWDYLMGKKFGKVVVLTFDDGYYDNFKNALPILKKFNFSATLFVVSDLIGSYNKWYYKEANMIKPLMNEDEIKIWIDSGMEIGSHTRTHPILTNLKEKELEDEIINSKEILERKFKVEIKHFCYPYGKYNDLVVSVVKKANYLSAWTLDRGRFKVGDDILRGKRINIPKDANIIRFYIKLFTSYEEKRALSIVQTIL